MYIFFGKISIQFPCPLSSDCFLLLIFMSSFYTLDMLYYAMHSCSVMSESLRPHWTVAQQTPLSMGILQASILKRLPCSLPGDRPRPGIKPRSPTLQADSLPSEPPGKPHTLDINPLSYTIYKYFLPVYKFLFILLMVSLLCRRF